MMLNSTQELCNHAIKVFTVTVDSEKFQMHASFSAVHLLTSESLSI